jgi:hypothetical protein
MTTPTTLAFHRWIGGPTGHAIELGVVAWMDPDAPAAWVDPALERYGRDLPHGWLLPDVLARFRPGRTAVAYGDPYAPMASALGTQALAWAERGRQTNAAPRTRRAGWIGPHTHAHAHPAADTHKHEHPYAVVPR